MAEKETVMGKRGKNLEKVEQALMSAWNEDTPFEFVPGWDEAVMRDIRSRSAAAWAGQAAGGFGPLVLRFAAVAAAVTVLFLILALESDIASFHDLAMMFLDDPAGFIISPPSV
ncbi:MAG: hypothetical protein MUF59_10675 [Candidatus Krumholzibacteria bacterium]|nr:hypothetical protein [Candidatus Krumholzibacteria bacterium]